MDGKSADRALTLEMGLEFIAHEFSATIGLERANSLSVLPVQPRLVFPILGLGKITSEPRIFSRAD